MSVAGSETVVALDDGSTGRGLDDWVAYLLDDTAGRTVLVFGFTKPGHLVGVPVKGLLAPNDTSLDAWYRKPSLEGV